MTNPTIVGSPSTVASAGSYTAGAGSNRLVVALLYAKGSTAPTFSSATLGGASPTTIVSVRDNLVGDRDAITAVYWKESQILSGAQTLSVSWTGSSLELKNVLYTVQDADQSSPIRATVPTGASNFSAISLAITSIQSGDLCIGGSTCRNNVTFTQTSSWTADFDAILTSGSYHAAHHTSTGTSDTWSANFSASSDTSCAAFAIAPVTSTPGTALPGVGSVTINGNAVSVNQFSVVTIKEVLINEAGSPMSNRTGMSLLVWYGGRPIGTPDLSYSALTTDANGTASWNIATGSLVYNQDIFYLANDGGASLSAYTCAHMRPTYQ